MINNNVKKKSVLSFFFAEIVFFLLEIWRVFFFSCFFLLNPAGTTVFILFTKSIDIITFAAKNSWSS